MSDDLYNSTPNVAPSFLESIIVQKTEDYIGEEKPTIKTSVVLFDSKTHNTNTGDNRLIELNINEGMLNAFVYGYIDVRNSDDWVGALNFTGTERVKIKFRFGDSDKSVEFICTIYSVKIINNFVDNLTKKTKQDSEAGIERTISYRLEFISEEIFNTIFDKSLLYGDKDFIGYIANDKNSDDEIPGLVNTIAKSLNVDLDTEATRNAIWLKSGEISFPSGIPQGQMKLSNLMQYICNYAVSDSNPNAANYFFWRDRSGYHFKSVEKMLNDSKEIKATFNLNTDDETDITKVRGIQVINQYDNLHFLDNYVYSSHYIRSRPNYDEAYLDFVSPNFGFTYDVVSYNYHRDWNKIQHVEDFKLLSNSIPTNPIHENKKPKPITRIQDGIFGFYDSIDYDLKNSTDRGFGHITPTIHKHSKPWWSYLSKGIHINDHTIHDDSRISNSTWQPQYDMTELDVSLLHRINKKIREPLSDLRKEFVRLKDIKRKWEVYRCVVCCLDRGGMGSTGDISLRQEILDPDSVEESLLNSLGLDESLDDMFGSLERARDVIFGPTGPFGDMNLSHEYKVVAAGSFTDVINYDPGAPGSINGLTFSYDLNKEPYNQTIGQFYNIKEELPNYVKYVIERGLRLYTLAIEDCQEQIDDLDDFISKTGSWINQLDELNLSFLNSECVDIAQKFATDNPHRIPYWPHGGFRANKARLFQNASNTIIDCVDAYTFNINERTINYDCNEDVTNCWNEYGGEDPTAAQQCADKACFEPPDYNYNNPKQIPNPLYLPLPGWVKECSSHPSGIIPGYIKSTNLIPNQDFIYKISDNYKLQNQALYDVERQFNPFAYLNPIPPNRELYDDNEISQTTELKRCIDNGDCYLTQCLDPFYLEYGTYYAKQKRNFFSLKLKLLQEIKNKLEQGYISKWQQLFTEWRNRKAFFYSKIPTPGEIILDNVKKKIQSPLSLYNISSIKRKPIRGSRYEILAKSIGVEDGKIEEWAYNIFFGNSESLNLSPDISREASGYTYDANHFPGSSERSINDPHPYYDQGYSIKNGFGSFITQRSPYYIHLYKDNFALNNISYRSQFVETPPVVSPGIETATTESAYYLFPAGQADDIPNMEKIRLMDYDLNSLPGYSDLGFIETFNIFSDDLSTKKPPNIKREEIASYVRIEFQNPIGLDRLLEFPKGFIRDVGTEYFLPYLVSLTTGPTGRQSIRNNIAIIGIDPYGFDVAIKKMNIEDHTASKKYEWYEEQDTNLNETSMELWPEYGFETERPYYTCDPKTNYTDTNSYQGAKVNNIQKTMVREGTNKEQIGEGSPGFVTGYSRWGNGIMDDRFNTTKRSVVYGMETDSQGNNISILGPQTDPEYKQTANGTGYLLSSHKKIKPHRTWWSFEFPKNIFIPQRLTGFANNNSLMFGSFKSNSGSSTTFYAAFDDYDIYNTTGFAIPGSVSFYNADSTGSFVYGYHENYWWYGSELDRWIRLADTPITRQLLKEASIENPNSQLSFIPKIGDGFIETMNVHSDLPFINGFFDERTNHWMTGDHMLYRPGLLTTDVWKYDISGETEYGLIHPPTSQPNYDLFDQNFAAQFVVHARSSAVSSCSEHYVCANQHGTVSSFGCPDSDPYCNCPAKNMIPDEKEPTYLELYMLYNKIRECELIETNLGPEYLGCLWSDPNNPCSCNCPEIGDKFKTYLEYTRTYATFWSTPRNTPLIRNSQISQLFSQKITILVTATSKVNVGDLVYLFQINKGENKPKQKNLHGKWLVLEIGHSFTKNSTQGMKLTLCRDGLPIDPNDEYL